MFDFPIKQRKLTTYGRKTSKPASPSLAQEDASLQKPNQTTLRGWKSGTLSASIERTQASAAAGKLTRPPPKKSNDTLWDGPSEEDEPVQFLKSTSKSTRKAAAPNVVASKHLGAKSVLQNDIGVKESQDTAGKERKRKRGMVTRATSEAPGDVAHKADIVEVPGEETRVVRRAKSIEPSRPPKSSAPTPTKKNALNNFNPPTKDKQFPSRKNPRPAPGKKKELQSYDPAMEGEETMVATKSRAAKPRGTSLPPRQQAQRPALSKRKDVDGPVDDARQVVADISRPALCKKKAMDIFDFPSEDEEPTTVKKVKAPKPRESSQTPLRKRARTPALDTKGAMPISRSRQTNTPESSRINNPTRKAKSKATTPEPSRKGKITQRLKSPNPILKPTKALPGVGWHPNLAIHTSPNRGLRQGLSAPASLFSMIREQHQSPPTDSSANVTQPAAPGLASDEMEIDITLATPLRAGVGSSPMVQPAISLHTPRQKQLWGQLLGPEPGDSPSDLPISKLNLESIRKPPSIARASSDIPQTISSRRSRLIDSLKASAPIVEDEEDDDDDDDEDDRDTTMESSLEPLVLDNVQRILVQPEASIKTASTKVTYAQQRTFLEEQNEEAMYDILTQELSQQTSGYGSQNQNNLFEESDLEDNEEAHPRGVHDLRAAGSKRRLLDELDHLVDDVQGMAVATVSARRSALMEIAEKLIEPSAATIFLDSGMDLRLIKGTDDMTDTVFTFLAATTISLLSDSGATLNTLGKIHRSKMFDRIVGLLPLEQDIAKVVKERRSNMSKIAQASVVEFRDSILKSRLFTSAVSTKLSPQLMALRCLESVVRKFRDQGSRATLFDQDVVATLLRLAESRAAAEINDCTILELVISILEAHTLSRSAGWPLELVKIFVNILPPIFGSSDPALQHCKFLALRLSLNLTNENPTASDVFAVPTLTKMLMQSIDRQYALLRTKVASEDHAVNVDNTVLALGVMINLAEFSDRVRMSILDGGDELLTRAVKLFLDSKEFAEQADSVEEGQTNVAFGYLAFMLGNLCQNEEVRARVRQQLPGGNLRLLLGEMQEFIKIHQRADKVRLEGAEGEELENGHTQRLQALVDTLRGLDH
jgi:hypothetical protein